MKKGYLLLLTVLVGLSGCWKKKDEKKKADKNMASHVNIPVADDSIRSFFDEEMGEFELLGDNIDVEEEVLTADAQTDGANAYAWVEEKDMESADGFKTVYFGFNKHGLKKEQKEKIAYNAELAKKILEEAEEFGENATLVVDGHSCHSAGSAAYNLALSEKRAKVLYDELIEQGIPGDRMKIIGRGDELPAMVKGKAITGDKKDQWLNRRDEIHVVYS